MWCEEGEATDYKMAPHLGAGSCPNCSTPNSVPCDANGKVAEDGPSIWAPATREETWIEFQVPGFGLVQPGHCGHMWSEPADERSLVSLLVTLPCK